MATVLKDPLEREMLALGEAARAAAAALALAPRAAKDAALLAAAAALRDGRGRRSWPPTPATWRPPAPRASAAPCSTGWS